MVCLTGAWWCLSLTNPQLLNESPEFYNKSPRTKSARLSENSNNEYLKNAKDYGKNQINWGQPKQAEVLNLFIHLSTPARGGVCVALACFVACIQIRTVLYIF